MCSINGCTWHDPELVKRMNAATAHRGPDGTDVFAADAVTLGHNRLSIIDLSENGAQPMKSADGRYVITFNGEIYNYKELRSQLSDYPYRSESDTEVILAGFARWGTDVFARLNGIFALGIWDSEKKELVLARDRVGVKPLYMCRIGNRLLFASEAKAVLECADVTRELDTDALKFYVRLGYVPGEATLFKTIRRLPAGHYARVSMGKFEMKSFVARRHPAQDLTGRAAEEAVREAVDAAVRRQLVSDRPLGLFLSGGIDSSTVLDAMSRAGGIVDTYSVGFDLPEGNQSEKFNADFLLARRTAAHYGARHHEFLLGPSGLPELFEQAVYQQDEPAGNATALAQLSLSRLAKETVTVVLCGDGGDELFGGYPRYLMSRRMDAYQAAVPAPLRVGLAKFGRFAQLNTPPGAARYKLFHFVKDGVVREVAPRFVDSYAEHAVDEKLRSFGEQPFIDAFMRLDREWWLVDESLARTDKMTMAAGVEARVPLLDNDMLDLAARIPYREKVTLWETKRVLRRAMRPRLPEYLFSQPKRGWFSPGAKWLRLPEFNAYAKGVLSPEYAAATRDLLDWRGVERIFEDHVAGRRYNLPLIWNLLALQVWARRFRVTV